MALIMIMFAAGFQSEGLSILSVVMLVITIILYDFIRNYYIHS